MREYHELLDGYRPFMHEPFDQRREHATVARNVQPAVVAQVHGREPAVGRERGAVIVAFAPPLQVVHAQTVDEQEDPASRPRDRALERRALEVERLAVVAQRHLDRERIAAVSEVVTEHAVQCREHRFALERRRAATDQWRELSEQRINAAADKPRDAADRPVDEPGDAARGCLRRRTQRARPSQNVVMHGLDEARQAEGRIDGETAESADVGAANVRLLGNMRFLGHDWVPTVVEALARR